MRENSSCIYGIPGNTADYASGISLLFWRGIIDRNAFESNRAAYCGHCPWKRRYRTHGGMHELEAGKCGRFARAAVGGNI